MVTSQPIRPVVTQINASFYVTASGMFLTTFFHTNQLVGRHMLCCSWRFIIFYFGICERMLLFGKQQRLAGTYGKCWNTWDLLMRIQRTCVKWGGNAGQWTDAMHDSIMSPTASKSHFYKTLIRVGDLIVRLLKLQNADISTLSLDLITTKIFSYVGQARDFKHTETQLCNSVRTVT